MTKKIKKLEKETTLWRNKWETNNQALLQMAEEVSGGGGCLLLFNGSQYAVRRNLILVQQ